ncbi:uncharacterized protein PODANS_0_700 [Podospora anserina S mat+]|uniref:Podospora anserina S mat+ genomic DNA chromosome 2, supercontig 1 n=1 Tax=Podospora anserina (strain S / ATCC MYA-4624 / DSM 980 / FGSC 10383) TaxID=515849 RepID=B2ABW3_PODAN|nr:uncharacterized protein PODANS_0_700 [Podospora anserina S mat+]CAP60885.1 unnamed protein product [Podospora anserina S mat+]CDP24898.1 Putative protein of unknown function [Podospora anserina S mat+]
MTNAEPPPPPASGPENHPDEAPLLKTFTRLSKQVYVQEPVSSPPPGAHETDPTTVIIYGWGDAAPKHLSKYVTGYTTLFPYVRLVLIFSPILKTLYQTLDSRSKTMIPVIEALYGPISSLGSSAVPSKAESKERILLQVMSNTGGMNLAATMYAFTRAQPTEPAQVFPYDLMVLDSTPGSTAFLPNIAPWSRAMAIGASRVLPFLPFIVIQAMAALFLATLHGVGQIMGATSAAVFSVAAVNDPSLSDITSKRLYLYSKEDDIIHWEDIERHAADAKSKGWDVSAETFEGTRHVGHMKAHPDKYWTAISAAWKDAVKKRDHQ